MSWFWATAGEGYLDSGVPDTPITAYPFSVFIWFKFEGTMSSDDQTLFWIADSAVADNHWGGSLGSAASDGVRVVSRGTTQFTGTTSTDITASTWENAIFTFVGDASRFVWLNNGGEDESTGGSTPTGLDKISIGMENDSSRGDWWEGYLAEFAVWDVEIDATHRAILNAGFSPLCLWDILPNLVCYEPMNGPTLNRYQIHASAPTFTAGNQGANTTPVYAQDHPAITYPEGQNILYPRKTIDISGTATASIDESDMVTGGKQIIIDLNGDRWVEAL